MPDSPAQNGAIGEFIEQYRRRELLRFLTCGSVDDGKSTLIGRLLHDSHGVYDDQLHAARRDSSKHGSGGGEFDLAFLVDGLQAEREQGITIDVAYRYFSTPRRKFIIADTPGHEQYTRNMATGASTCDLAVILVDATRGIIDQTRRHAFIATLLGIRHLVVAINKMDLVGFEEARFEELRQEFASFATKLQVADIHFIPVSALHGDNVVHRSDRMEWFRGGPLLDYLETLHIASDRNLIDLRLPVQLVVRRGAVRGYAGSLLSGVVRKGDPLTVLPSGRRTHVQSILGTAGEHDEAFAPMAVTVTLSDDVDVSRGDMLVHPNNSPRVDREFEAMIVWMHDRPASAGDEYLLKQTTVVIPAIISEIRYRMNVNTLRREPCAEVLLNEIARVRIETPRLLAFDSYVRNRGTGAFILIDRLTNATVGAGMILDHEPASSARHEPSAESRQLIGPRRHALQVRVGGAEAHERAAAIVGALGRRGTHAELVDLQLAGDIAGDASAEIRDRLAAYLQRLGISVVLPVDAQAAATIVVDSRGEAVELAHEDPDSLVEALLSRKVRPE